MPTQSPPISASDSGVSKNAFGTEAFLQPGGGAEDAAIYADILSKDHDIGIICEGPGKRQIDRVDQRRLRH
jgi:hypothetical protein